MSYTVNGVVQSLTFQKVKYKDKEIEKAILKIDTKQKYDNLLTFESFERNGNFPTMGLKVGDTVHVQFNIKQREYKDQVYTSLVAWSVTVDGYKKEKSSGKTLTDEIESQELPF